MPGCSMSCCAVATAEVPRDEVRIKVVSLNRETGVVRYSYDNVVGHDDDYVLLETVIEKKLAPESVKRLAILLAKNWATRPVVPDESQVTVVREKYTNYRFFEIKGPYEEWKCHRLGPEGAGSHMTEAWKKIEDIIEAT